MNKKNIFLSGDEFVSEVIFNQGCKFYDSYKILQKEKEKEKEKETSHIPALVCLIFSIELFIKSLRVRKNNEEVESYTEGMKTYLYTDKSILKGGHDLQKLFSNLTQKTRSKIEENYEKKYKSSFTQDITNISGGFVNWRYIYEGKTNVIYLSAVQNIGEFMFDFLRNRL